MTTKQTSNTPRPPEAPDSLGPLQQGFRWALWRKPWAGTTLARAGDPAAPPGQSLVSDAPLPADGDGAAAARVHEPCSFRCVEGFDPATASRLAADPEGLLWEHLHEPIKLSHTSVMVRALIPAQGPDGGSLCVAYKQFRPKNVLKAVLALLRTSPAVRAWQRGHALLRNGIPTARPVAACVPRRRWHRLGYLATEWIEGAENLHLWGWRIADDGPTRRLRRAARCAESLGRLAGRLHGRCFSHRDLKAANLLVREVAGQAQTWLVDLEGLRHRRRLSFRRRVADLARLAASVEAHPWVTPAVMLRFLRSYLDEVAASRSVVPPPWKALWRAVARQAAARNRRKRRRRQAVL